MLDLLSESWCACCRVCVFCVAFPVAFPSVILELHAINQRANTQTPQQMHTHSRIRVHTQERIDRECGTLERGDVLVFVSGTAEIDAVAAEARPYAAATNRWIVLP